jgi:hypothetical protein
LGSLGVISWSSVCFSVVLRCLGGVKISALGTALRYFGVEYRSNISRGVLLSLGTAVAVAVSEMTTRLISFAFSPFNN